MVPFAGWDMPVEYSGIVAEHLAVRTRAGLFDVSHMGEIEIAGKDALAAVQRWFDRKGESDTLKSVVAKFLSVDALDRLEGLLLAGG